MELHSLSDISDALSISNLKGRCYLGNYVATNNLQGKSYTLTEKMTGKLLETRLPRRIHKVLS